MVACAAGRDSISREHLDAFCQLVLEGWAQDNDAFRQIMTSQMYPGASAEEMRSFNHMQRMACSPQEAANIRRLIADCDAMACLPGVCCPTLVLHNLHDAMVPFESQNHVPLCEGPAFARVHRLIDDFVHGVPLTAA